jgi:hypothetical protein
MGEYRGRCRMTSSLGGSFRPSRRQVFTRERVVLSDGCFSQTAEKSARMFVGLLISIMASRFVCAARLFDGSRIRRVGLILFLLALWPHRSFSNGTDFGFYWKDNTLPYDTEFSYFYDVAVYPEGGFADENPHYFAYVTAQNKHIIYNSVPYSVELVIQYGLGTDNAHSFKRVWATYYNDPARFTDWWIDTDADGIDYWELATLDGEGYLVTEQDGHGEFLRFLEVQAQTIFISESTNPVRSVWQNRFYFFNFITQHWDMKVWNSFTIPASREAVRDATFATGGAIWAGILETLQQDGTMDNGRPPVKNMVYKNRSIRVVDHGVTVTPTLTSSYNGFVVPASPYQLLYSSPNTTVEYVAGPSTCVISAQASPPMGGRVTGAGTFPNPSLVQLSAIPTAGYGFVNWTENGIPVSNSDTFNFSWTGYRTLVANFGSTVPFTVDSLEKSQPAGFSIHWTGLPKNGYQVQSNDGLSINGWHNLGAQQTVPTSSTLMSYTDASAVGNRRFYRVVRTSGG